MISTKPGKITVVQYNWIENLRKNEKIWVYHKPLHENSQHGFINDDSFSLTAQDERSLLVMYNPTNQKTLFVRPIKQFNEIHSKSIISLDVADGGLGVSVSTDNKLHVWETQDGVVRRQLEGHLFDVYSCRLYPSGVVVLSGGADMQMKIWDAASGLCPVTLIGHKGPIMDICFVERGKNIISVSKDGTVRLWNCAQAKCLAVLQEESSVLNCCDIIDGGNEINLPENNSIETDELEFGTERKLLAVGSDSGVVSIISVKSRQTLTTKALNCPVLCICWLPSFHLVVGLENGQVVVLDAKKLGESPELLSHDSASGVLCIRTLGDGFILGRKDGVCQFYRLDGNSPVQLTGPNCDPVYDLAVDSQFVYTACRDAIIRKYRILDMKMRDL